MERACPTTHLPAYSDPGRVRFAKVRKPDSSILLPPSLRTLEKTISWKTVLVLFVEYHAAFRQAASYLMDRESDLEVVSQAGSVAEGRQKIAEGGIETAIVSISLSDEGAPELVRVSIVDETEELSRTTRELGNC